MASDPVADLFTRARTERGPVPSPSDGAALRAVDRIVRADHRHRSPRWSAGRRLGLAAIAATVAVVFGVLSPAWFALPSALALTPAPLTYTSGPTASDVLDALSRLPESSVVAPVRGSTSETWAVSIDGDSGRITPRPPQIEQLTWNEDRSGHILIVADKPFWPTSAQLPQEVSSVPEPGAVLLDTRFAPGELGVPFPAVPGESQDQLREALHAFGLPARYTSQELAHALIRLLKVWTLSDAQHRQLVAILLSAPGAQVRGSAEDHTGRAVIGVKVGASEGSRDILLISQETGRIVGVESVAQKDEGPVRAGTVVYYRLWDTED